MARSASGRWRGRRARRPRGLLLAGTLATVLGLAACSTPAPSRHVTLPTTLRSGSAPTTGPTTTTAPTTTTTTTNPASSYLSEGSSGPAVLALQQRLSSLGYWLGTPDGTFGEATEQAVYALQKAAGIERDGIVGPVTEAALTKGVVPTPQSTSGYVVEVDLHDDLLMVVDNGQLKYTLNTSTGGGYWYTDDGVTALAETPTGHFSIIRQVDGMVVDSLGQLWMPKFFYEGFAIHGDSYVPAEPVSHGCVRVSDEAIEWIWADDVIPIGTSVWIY